MQAARGTTLNARRRGVGLIAVGIAVLGVGLDQLVKWASVAYLTPGEPVQLLGRLLQLNLIRNPGAAFGLGSGFTIVFSVFAILALAGCLYALTRITRLWHAIVLGLLMAGVTGNLIDRIIQPPRALHGHVVDMFQLAYFDAIFNVADMCITFAAVIMIIMTLLHDRREGKARA